MYTQVFLVYPQCSGVPPGVPTPVWPHRPFTIQKNGGRDHVFGYSSWNPGVAKGIGLHRVSKLLKQGHFGVFEVNNAWIGANSQEAGRLDLRDRMIPMPYVVNAATFRGDHREVHTHEISVFFAAKARGNAVGWAGCDRRKGLGLQSVPRSVEIKFRAPHAVDAMLSPWPR